MEDTNIIEIVAPDGSFEIVNLITYLISDDGDRKYVVYSKSNDKDSDDRIIYISKFHNDNNVLSISEITDDNEWSDVQKLLRKIANAN